MITVNRIIACLSVIEELNTKMIDSQETWLTDWLIDTVASWLINWFTV